MLFNSKVRKSFYGLILKLIFGFPLILKERCPQLFKIFIYYRFLSVFFVFFSRVNFYFLLSVEVNI